jgi:hypothetical protein
MTRTVRQRFAVVAAMALLWSQFVTALHACPLPELARPSAAAHVFAASMTHCAGHQVAAERHNHSNDPLCVEHCSQGSADKTSSSLPHVPPCALDHDILNLTDSIATVPALHVPHPRVAPLSLQRPSLSRLCSLQI